MSYNSQVEEFVKGDLVYFTGYQVDNPPLAHKIGIVMSHGTGNKPFTMYEVMWLHTGNIITVAAKHLSLAYTR
tara:strand:- start:2653 stop:2871 length:219 start_codon:yes stop_codon:yes gene_type:complete